MNWMSSCCGSMAMPGHALSSASVYDTSSNSSGSFDFIRLSSFIWLYYYILVASSR